MFSELISDEILYNTETFIQNFAYTVLYLWENTVCIFIEGSIKH